jgi:UDP-glucose 4-epimerase
MFVNDVVNIGGEVETTVLELAKLIIRITKSKSQIVYLPPLEEGDMSRRRPDTSKMKQLLHRDLITLENGLERVIADLKYIL